ncbi:MAG: hypothetical protein SFX18_14375 [Pirellulales bacterium]|nr:hypothetical protein [Pirellulales bacterium]
MTKQETFDIVYRHLLTQGQKSISRVVGSENFGKCAYRGADGAKCAAGVLIPDEAYKPSYEGHSVAVLSDVFEQLGHDLKLC